MKLLKELISEFSIFPKAPKSTEDEMDFSINGDEGSVTQDDTLGMDDSLDDPEGLGDLEGLDDPESMDDSLGDLEGLDDTSVDEPCQCTCSCPCCSGNKDNQLNPEDELGDGLDDLDSEEFDFDNLELGATDLTADMEPEEDEMELGSNFFKKDKEPKAKEQFKFL